MDGSEMDFWEDERPPVRSWIGVVATALRVPSVAAHTPSDEPRDDSLESSPPLIEDAAPDDHATDLSSELLPAPALVLSSSEAWEMTAELPFDLSIYRDESVNTRQAHGYWFERFAEEHLPVALNDHGVFFDARHVGDDLPVQIKFRQGDGRIEFGDMNRNIDLAAADREFYLLAGSWNGVKHRLASLSCFRLSSSIWMDLFGGESVLALRTEANNIIRAASNDRSYDSTWKTITKDFHARYKGREKAPLLDFNFKRDHKTQKRIQVSISSRNVRALDDYAVDVRQVLR